MNWLHSRIFKVISFVVLFFFTWTSGGLFQVAYAIKDSQESGVQSSELKTEKPEEKLQKALEEIEGILTDTSTDTGTKKNKLKTEKTEIESLDVEIKKQFKETEDKIKDLPDEILQRHKDFVKHYDDNLKELNADLDAIEKAKTEVEVNAQIEKTKAFLEKVKPPKKHTPLDPNNLPHRTAEPVFVEPRTIPEQFLEELSAEEQKSNSATAVPTLAKGGKGGFEKPILVASSSDSLAGLLNVNSKYSNDAVIPAGLKPESSSFKEDSGYPIDTFGYDKLNKASIPSNMLLALASPPTSADLAETIEVQFTHEIAAKAEELQRNPLKIYNWVRNNIEFVPTYGSIQGANMCLQTKQCNAFDTSSLLIALLRASNIPAKYVQGTVEIPIEKVKNWVGGFTDANSAMTLMASGGIPGKGLTSGGQIAAVQMEHVWVEAWIDYIPSRGTVHKQGDTWIPLDASFKEFTYKKGIDVKSVTGFNPQSFVDSITTAATIDPVTGSITNVPTGEIQSQMDTMVNAINNYIDVNMPDATVGDVLGAKEIVQHNYRILPASLPFEVVVTGNKFSQMPDNLRHKITVAVANPDGIGQPLSYNAPLAQIALKRLTLGYIPATEQDAQAMTKYGYYDVPPYLVHLKPVLYIDGIATVQGGSLGMGETQTLSITFAQPGRKADSVLHQIAASSFASIGLDMQTIPKELIAQRKVQLDQAAGLLGVQDVKIDDIIGETLNLHSLMYFYQVEIANKLATHGEIAYTKKPAEMLSTLRPSISYLYGVPFSVTGLGMGVDVKRYIMSPVSLSGNTKDAVAYMQTVGAIGSTYEHAVFEELNQDMQGISAIKIISIATQQGIPIYQIDSTNSAAILPKLQISSETMGDIRNAIASGKIVTIPERTIQYYDWVGDGYIIINPTTGDGAYMIAGGLAGGEAAQNNDVFMETFNNAVISFADIATEIGIPSASTAKSAAFLYNLKKVIGYVGMGVEAFFLAFNMYVNTGSKWKTLAAATTVIAIGLLVATVIEGIAAMVVSSATLILGVILAVSLVLLISEFQQMVLEAIRTAYQQFRSRRKHYAYKRTVRGYIYAS